MEIKLTFWGAAGAVTGSKYLVEGAGKRILVDCGLFQGPRAWREHNWHDPEMDLSTINAVLITHAHIDHIGILPRYHQLGLNCPIYATHPTVALARILLPDSGYLQEEEARYRSKPGKSRHDPPMPLYTEEDAHEVLSLFKGVPFHSALNLGEGVTATWNRMGHILGAASIQLKIGGKSIVFAGDIGQYSVPILQDPEPVELGDLLLIESTYGDRIHPGEDPKDELAEIISRTTERSGVVVIPSFAVGRAQLLLYYLRQLRDRNKIPNIPIYLDSPMATDATNIYMKFPEEYDQEALTLSRTQPPNFFHPQLIQSTEESIELNLRDGPMIIISASGMVNGGRILHHLKHRITESKNTILFVGFQPKGGRGDWILSGASSLKIFGEEVPIRAEICKISGLSAHADKDELLRWCKECNSTPKKVAVVHGEPESAQNFCETLKTDLGWDAFVAQYKQTIQV